MLSAILVCAFASAVSAQRVFNPTEDVVGIWEFNQLESDGVPISPGEAVPNGTIIPDLSGNGLDAVVEDNASGHLGLTDGDLTFGENDAMERIGPAWSGTAHVAVNNDGGAFEMESDQDFSIELYVRRAEVIGGETWGALAGTWHSRTLIDDTLDGNVEGAWYGYGLIETGGGANMWTWDFSAINADGTPRGLGCCNEQNGAAFEIPAGSHYIIASVDRETDQVSVYLDGELQGSFGLPDDGPLMTPEGYEHARMMFFAGEDDGSRGAYRRAPSGYAIDAARVLKRTISPEEALDNWLGIQDGDAVPILDSDLQAIVSANPRNVVVNQCVQLTAANSSPVGGIAKYEWRIGAGEFVEGDVEHQVSFDAPSGFGGSRVSLRVTDDRGDTSEATVAIFVSHPAPVPQLEARIGGEALIGTSHLIGLGEVLTLDASGSSSPVPNGAARCDGSEIAEPAITEYRWDLDSDGTIDDTRATFDLPPLASLDAFTVTLTLVNAAGEEASTSIDIEGIDATGLAPSPPGRIFLETEETVGIWEFNDLPVDFLEPLPEGALIPDLSGNGLDATVEANEGGELAAQDGDVDFTVDNTSCERVLGGNSRVVVNDDEDAFEMAADQDFSIELYVRRDEFAGSESWGILAGTWHSRTLIDDALSGDSDGAWYGYGLINNPTDGNHRWKWDFSPINADGTPRGFGCCNEWSGAEFELPAGSHYLVASVDRTTDVVSAYLDGNLLGTFGLPDDGPLTTPDGYEHARLMFLNGEDDGSRGAYRNPPTGYAIDGARVMYKALSAQEVRENFFFLQRGIAVPPSESTGASVKTGDVNGDGRYNIADPVAQLSFQFGGVGLPECYLIPNSDPPSLSPAGLAILDHNGDGMSNISDAVGSLNFLFGSGAPPALGEGCAVLEAPCESRCQ